MTEIAISVAAKVVEYLVAPIARPFGYLWNHKSNFENLKNEVKKLEGRRDSVQNSVEDARRNGEEIEKHVESWLDNVKNTIDEASELINGDDHHQQQQADMKCFEGFSCTNLKKLYQYSQKAAKLKAGVAGVREEAGKFEKVSYRTIPEETWIESSNNYKAFEARKYILKNIIDALSNPDVDRVGIYGMGGVGKTTLAKEVVRQSKQDELFREIVFVEVSQTLDIKKIQEEIADKLGLEFCEKTNSGRARRLCDRLKKEEKILLVLDNIWGSIDFEKVGIPFESNGLKGLKLLLTTRSSNLLTNEMDSQHNFHIEVLNEVDAWSLFKNITGTCIDNLDLKHIAFNIVRKCGGVPIAIVTIAKALKNKDIYEWNNALQELRNPSWKNFQGAVTKEVYTSIKLSYNYLESDELKAMFLLCSSMGCTYDASIRDLLRYGIGLSLFTGLNTMEAVTNRVATLVSKLKSSSLLLDTPDSEWFAMHDVVCDVARSIASQNEHVFTVIDDFIPQDWVYENTLENCTRISLHNIIELPEKLVCPKLMFLYIKPKVSFLRIHDQFFLEMPKLQVLHLVEMYLGSLPMSLGRLVNLKTLCLEECKLSNATIIRDLKKLEILSFRGSQIMKLPEEMRQLISLRLLDLTDCSKLRVIPAKVMSSLTQLEELYLENTSILWEMETDKVERSNASLDELKHLSNLTTLEIHIPDAKMSKGLLSHKLERYKIFIGDHSESWPMYGKAKYETSRALTLKLQTSEVGIITQLKGIRSLHLDQIPSVSNLLNELGKEGSLVLRHLNVKNSPYTSCIIDSMRPVSCDALPTLETLSLSGLIKLERICNGQLGTTSFRQLKIIKVNKCDRLNNIFSFSMDNGLPQLEEIAVTDCSRMEEIFVIERQDEVNNTEVNKTIQVSLLRIVTLGYMRCLKSLCSKLKSIDINAKGEFISENRQDISESLFNEMVVLPNMEILNLFDINVKNIWHNRIPTMSSSVQNLTRLIIKGCRNLRNIFSASMVNSFVQLQHIEIRNCPMLEEMVVIEELIEEGRKDIILLFPQLHYLRINHLVKLRRLYSGNYIEFPSLKEMEIANCFQSREFIFDDKVPLPNLEILNLFDIDVEKIWHNQLLGMSSSVQNLTRLIIKGCHNLKYLFSASMVNSFVQLQHLEISDCPVLEEVVVIEELIDEGSRDVILLFAQLHYIRIKHLVKLRRLYSGNYIEFPSLKELEIENCFNMRAFIFDDKVGIPSLEKMKISDMFNLKRIWHNQLAEDSFYKLKSLEVNHCCDLLTVVPSSMCGRSSRLESLIVCDCVNAEEIFDIQGINPEEKHSTVATTHLRNLYIKHLPSTKSIWNKDPRGMFSFENLLKVQVLECHDLKNLFPASVARSLSKLEYLSVFDCSVLKEIVAKERFVEEEAATRFIFPRMATLELCQLPELRTFYHGKHETDKKQQQHHFLVEKAFPCLEELKLSNEGILKQTMTLVKIRKLALSRLKDLKYMWKQDSRLDLILQNLEVLEVEECGSLITLMAPFASFQNLTILEVKSCKNLMNLVTSSTAKSLVQLITLTISHCYKITEVIENQEDRAEDKIIFSKLNSLSLKSLLSLRSFCSGNYILEFPSLEKLKVEGCDKLKIFSQGVLNMPALRSVNINWNSIEPDVDLNKTIQQLYEKEDVQSSEDDIEPSFLHLSDQGSDKDYGDFSRHDPNDRSFEEDCGDSSRKSDEDCGGSSRHHQNDQCSDEDSSYSS